MALKAGLKKGGAAKGELVLAIFELANSFRHGWGTKPDPIAAKQVGFSVRIGARGGRKKTCRVAIMTEGARADIQLQYYETAANLGDTGEYALMMRRWASSQRPMLRFGYANQPCLIQTP